MEYDIAVFLEKINIETVQRFKYDKHVLWNKNGNELAIIFREYVKINTINETLERGGERQIVIKK